MLNNRSTPQSGDPFTQYFDFYSNPTLGQAVYEIYGGPKITCIPESPKPTLGDLLRRVGSFGVGPYTIGISPHEPSLSGFPHHLLPTGWKGVIGGPLLLPGLGPHRPESPSDPN